MSDPAIHSSRAEFSAYRDRRRRFWDEQARSPAPSLGAYYRKKVIAAFRRLVPEGQSVLEIGCGEGDLLAALSPRAGVGVDFSPAMLALAEQRHPGLEFARMDAHELDLGARTFDFVILSNVANDLWDVQTVLERVRRYCTARTRLIANFYSHLWSGPMRIAQRLGLATPTLPQNWLTAHDMRNLLEVSGFEVIRTWSEVAAPLPVPLVSDFVNRFPGRVVPLRWLAITNFVLARALPPRTSAPPRVTVVVPARNESGNIDSLIDRVPEFGGGVELIFVEGHSTDDTYAAIRRAIDRHPQRDCRLLRQPGKGKGDAVRAGFAAATGEILMILDADMTVPPEDLVRFYELLVSGRGEFINGVRLVYPMEDTAMQFLNLVGNKLFSHAFSWLLGQTIRDTLCGTKALWAVDYRRIAVERAYFGDFDPFGDFDLLFGAARLGLRIVELPIRYAARKFGTTNISRWRHGWLLLRMVVFAARRIKFV